MLLHTYTRRQTLQLLGTGALGAMLASCSSSSAKEFVILSIADPNQNKPLIQAIEAAHPGVKLVWRQLTSETFTELFTAASVAGDQIDLVDLNGQDLHRYAVDHSLMDLSNLAYKGRFHPIGLQAFTISKKLWALPRGGISGFTFFYNKKLLAQIGMTREPQTYDDLKMLASKLNKIGVPLFIHPGQDIYLWPVWYFWAYAQTTNNQSDEYTFQTLAGNKKFTDPESVEALEIIARFAQDNLFIPSTNSLTSTAAWLLFTQGKGAFYYSHTSSIGTYRQGNFPMLDMSLIAPVLAVSNTAVKRQMPGGTGNALAMYHKIDPSRTQLGYSIMNLMTSDKWVKWTNTLNGDPVSCNTNVQASSDPIALKYNKECAPNQIIYLDWYWPPEITNAFQQNIQGIVAGMIKPAEAARSIQQMMDQLRREGYTFQS
ncbi:MAG TPA: ABC transporter substrate-binding protein [Ktedonobacteraceae bacterium]|nr:ABC transporter substrate-binding protein [Ktedonobacteraceae bacterium]